MDNYARCFKAFEKASWSFDEEVGDLSFDFAKWFLPQRLSGVCQPAWMDEETGRRVNQMRGHSYAHLFTVVEEFIIRQTVKETPRYVHGDVNALGAMLQFTLDETKHQRMFVAVKDGIAQGLGFRPRELTGKDNIARDICSHSSFAVFLLALAVEWLTQRHFVECFREEENTLDPTFVKVFRLHWTEEAQHARVDTLELRKQAECMSAEEVSASITEFSHMLLTLRECIYSQSELDVQSVEMLLEQPLEDSRRAELLDGFREESLWTFVVSGLSHPSFRKVYKELVPAQNPDIDELIAVVRA
jgi:hypothetical protein